MPARKPHLSELQKQALHALAKGIHPGTVKGARLNYLERRGLMRYDGKRWELTDEGRRALRGLPRRKVIHNPAATPDNCEPCSVVARPKVQVEGLSYSMTVTVGDRPPVSFSGTTLAELERDLAATSAELGKE